MRSGWRLSGESGVEVGFIIEQLAVASDLTADPESLTSSGGEAQRPPLTFPGLPLEVKVNEWVHGIKGVTPDVAPFLTTMITGSLC